MDESSSRVRFRSPLELQSGQACSVAPGLQGFGGGAQTVNGALALCPDSTLLQAIVSRKKIFLFLGAPFYQLKVRLF